jgi:preprotein translocase subunit SecA
LTNEALHRPIDALAVGLREMSLDLPVVDWAKEEGIGEEEISQRVHQHADEAYAERVLRNTPELMRMVEKQIVLQVLDYFWREHLVQLDHLRQVIGWRGYAQRDPLNEYKSEAFELFNTLISRWHEVATQQLLNVELAFDQPAEQPDPALDAMVDLDAVNARIEAGEFTPTALLFRPQIEPVAAPVVRDVGDPSTWGKVARNEPCPCGSGKKYKHCHGVL